MGGSFHVPCFLFFRNHRQNQIKTRDRFANKILDSLVALQQMTRGGLFTDESARASFA